MSTSQSNKTQHNIISNTPKHNTYASNIITHHKHDSHHCCDCIYRRKLLFTKSYSKFSP